MKKNHGKTWGTPCFSASKSASKWYKSASTHHHRKIINPWEILQRQSGKRSLSIFLWEPERTNVDDFWGLYSWDPNGVSAVWWSQPLNLSTWVRLVRSSEWHWNENKTAEFKPPNMWKQTQSFIYTIYNISIVHTIKFPIKKLSTPEIAASSSSTSN